MRGAVIYGPCDVRFKERAVPITAMTHIAFQEQLDSKAADWDGKGQRQPIPEVILYRLHKEIL